MTEREPPPPDPWGADSRVRSEIRSDVRAALGPRERRCAACGAVSRTTGRSCPACGAPFVVVRARRRWTRRTSLAAAVALAALVALVVALRPVVDRGKERDAARERRAHAAFVARERRRLAFDQRLRRGVATGARPGRRAVLAQVERAITRDARARVRTGELDVPVRRTECDPYPNSDSRRAAERDRTRAVLGYECVAVTADIPVPAGTQGYVTGYPFWARVDYRRLRFAWCKVNPKPGEGSGGAPIVIVALSPACRLS